MSRILSLHRYPVKSMLGETLPEVAVTERGFTGDRVGAVFSGERIASAKQIRKWGRLLQLTASYVNGAARVHLPDGAVIAAEDMDLALGDWLGQPVHYDEQRPAVAVAERTPLEVGEASEFVLAKAAPAGGFFDYAPLHLVATDALHALGDLEALRFRPNIVLDGPEPLPGQVLSLGDEVRVRVTVETPRCAVPQLAHGRVPPMPDLLRRLPVTALGRCVGVYAEVLAAGVVHVGDTVAPA